MQEMFDQSDPADSRVRLSPKDFGTWRVGYIKVRRCLFFHSISTRLAVHADFFSSSPHFLVFPIAVGHLGTQTLLQKNQTSTLIGGGASKCIPASPPPSSSFCLLASPPTSSSPLATVNSFSALPSSQQMSATPSHSATIPGTTPSRKVASQTHAILSVTVASFPVFSP